MSRTHLNRLSRRWWLLILGPVLAGGVAFVTAQTIMPAYHASVTLLVKPANAGDASGRLTNTYAQLAERPAVLDAVIKQLSLSIDRDALAKKISVATIPDTQLLRVEVADRQADFAAKLANATAQAFSDDIAGQQSPSATLSIVRAAETPHSRSGASTLTDVLAGAALGLLAAGGIALALERLNDTVESAADAETVAGLPTLSVVGRFDVSEGLAAAPDPRSGAAEAYRQLRTNVHFRASDKALKTIVVTSANPGEGKSTTALNLATVLAQAGSRVVLVDADLRKASLSRAFDAPATFGLNGLLHSEIQNPALAFVSTRWKNLQLLPAGALPPNPSELLTSARMVRIIAALRERADYVVFDTPAVLGLTDAIVLAARADGTVLVAEAGRTRGESLRRAARMLSQATARALGVVVNKAKTQPADSYEPGAVDGASFEVEASRPRGLDQIPASAANGGSVRPIFPTSFANHAAGVATGSESTPLGTAVNDLLSHLDETVGLIQSLRPGSNGRGV